MSQRIDNGRALSLDVQAHTSLRNREAAEHGYEPYLAGTLKITGDLALLQDLNPGERLTVSVADADGTILTTSTLEVDDVGFKPIRDRETVIGTERIHKAKVTNG